MVHESEDEGRLLRVRGRVRVRVRVWVRVRVRVRVKTKVASFLVPGAALATGKSEAERPPG